MKQWSYKLKQMFRTVFRKKMLMETIIQEHENSKILNLT